MTVWEFHFRPWDMTDEQRERRRKLAARAVDEGGWERLCNECGLIVRGSRCAECQRDLSLEELSTPIPEGVRKRGVMRTYLDKMAEAVADMREGPAGTEAIEPGKLYDATEAAELVGVTKTELYRLGRTPGSGLTVTRVGRKGGKNRYRGVDLISYLEGRQG